MSRGFPYWGRVPHVGVSIGDYIIPMCVPMGIPVCVCGRECLPWHSEVLLKMWCEFLTSYTHTHNTRAHKHIILKTPQAGWLITGVSAQGQQLLVVVKGQFLPQWNACNVMSKNLDLFMFRLQRELSYSPLHGCLGLGALFSTDITRWVWGGRGEMKYIHMVVGMLWESSVCT